MKLKRIVLATALTSLLISCSSDNVQENNKTYNSQLSKEKIDLGRMIARSLSNKKDNNLLTTNKFENQNEVLLVDFLKNFNLNESEKSISREFEEKGDWECFVYNQDKIKQHSINDLLVLFVPENDDAKTLYGVDITGNPITIDAKQPSNHPILFIDSHGKFAFQKNIQTLNSEIEKRTDKASAIATQTNSKATPVDFNKIDSIRLNDVQEPWFKGNPEIYAIVFNFDKNYNDNTIPPLRVLQMPYITKAGVTYTPEQPFVFWNEHTRNAASMIIMEEDSGFDYSKIVQIVVQAIGTGVSIGTGDTIWTNFAVNTINSVIDAIRGDWWKDTDDNIDQFYIIRKENTTTPKVGASQNATISYSFETL